jgi:hypothetical protein
MIVKALMSIHLNVFEFVMCKTEDLGNGKDKRLKMYFMR